MDVASASDAALREALRLSEERADLALDAADAGVFDCDLTTGILYGSLRFRTALGLPDGPIDVRTTIAQMHPDDREGALRPWNLPEVNGRVAWNARARPVGSTEWRLIETRARVFRNEHGRAVRLIGVLHDVTDARRQMDALRESEWRLAQAQRIAGIGSWSWAPATNEIVWTDELFRIFDIEAGGRQGPAFDEYLGRIVEADRPTLLTAIERALADGTTYTLEHAVVLRDGQHRRIRSHGGALRDEHGTIVRLVGTAQDITEQSVLSERVRRSEERYALAVQGTSDGIWHYDMHTRVTEVSPRLLELLGRPHNESSVSTDWVSTVVPENDLELLKDAVRRHLGQGAPLDLEMPLRTPVRGVRWFRLRGRAVRNEAGVPQLLAGTLSDVTEHRALQTKLQHDSKMNALGTLAGGIAHDFNNLVAAMMGYAQLAAEEVPADSTAAAHLGQVIDAARRAREIVREILAFSRPEEPRRSAVDLRQLAEATARLMQPTLPSNVRLQLEDETAARVVLGDAGQLQRVLLNLCTNSVDAVRERGGEVMLHLASILLDEQMAPSHGLLPGHYVRLRISDNGSGIAPDAVARVFEPFFTTKAVGEGTGLGLSVVHGIVTAAGGIVTLESAEHVGTTVTVLLPQLDLRAESARPAGDPMPAQVRHVVVVDDEPAVGRLLQMALQRAHYHVTLFTSAGEALAALTHRTVECDCIVTDFAMPELNGIDLLVRAREAGVDVPAIMVTGFAAGASSEMRDRAKVTMIIEKPIELRAFVEMVTATLLTA
ncbi:MAG: PAS domain-containing protein [Gemmatimonadaceae bacterium]|nr:PAS domain-containing protein [Gemmatimonadaceae bacterium]